MRANAGLTLIEVLMTLVITASMAVAGWSLVNSVRRSSVLLQSDLSVTIRVHALSRCLVDDLRRSQDKPQLAGERILGVKASQLRLRPWGHMPGDPKGRVEVIYRFDTSGRVFRRARSEQRQLIAEGPVIWWEVRDERLWLLSTIAGETVRWEVGR
jgi:prepilin-type N-terminal cleavage/methylation domain-containing protein